MRIIYTLGLIICLSGIIFSLIGLIDSFTITEIGIEKVPCIDRYGREFENELCDKKITCSKLAFFGNADYKCSDYRVRCMEDIE